MRLTVAAVSAGLVLALAFGAPGPVSGGAAAAAAQRGNVNRGTPPDDRAIRRAFDEVLRRTPSAEEVRRYRLLMLEDGWTERDIREDLRPSGGRQGRGRGRGRGTGSFTVAQADRIVRQVYRDLLERDADPAGLQNYRGLMVNEGWSEQDVRDAIMDSAEYRNLQVMTRPRAQEIVRQVYLEVLGREPDPASRGWVDAIFAKRMTRADLERELRNSEEYRNRNR